MKRVLTALISAVVAVVAIVAAGVAADSRPDATKAGGENAVTLDEETSAAPTTSTATGPAASPMPTSTAYEPPPVD